MKPRATRRLPHERRRLILDGAEGVFAASGYGGADTTALARAGGVSAAALYRYFPTKKDLFLETLRVSGARLTQIWEQIVEDASDPIEAMELISNAYNEHQGSSPPVMRLWFQSLSDTDAPEVREVLRENIANLAQILEKNLVRAQRAGLIDRDVDPRVAAWDFMAVGFTFEISRLIGLSGELDRDVFRRWIKHHFKSIGVKRRGSRRRKSD